MEFYLPTDTENIERLWRETSGTKYSSELYDVHLNILHQLTVAGIVLGMISTNGVLSQLGILIGRGAVISFILVIFVLPGLLMVFDKLIEKLTLHADFYKGGKAS